MSGVSQKYSTYLLHHPGPASPRLFRAVKAYVTHVPVNNPNEAKVLSRRVAWDILSHVRASGSNGISAGELSTSLNIPLSDVYSILRGLTTHELIFKVPRGKGVHRGRRKYYVSQKLTWKKYGLNRTLTQILEREGILGELTDSLKEPFVTSLVQAAEGLARTELYSLLPSPGKTGLCLKCGVNHEALDFFNALGLLLVGALMESSEFKTLLNRLGYSSAN